MSNTNTIPSLVRELRQRLGLTQEELAKHLGVRFQTVNRWERGHAQPSPLALKAIKREVRDMGAQGTDLMEAYFRE